MTHHELRVKIKQAVDEISDITLEREGVRVVSNSDPEWNPEGDREVIAIIESLFLSHQKELTHAIEGLKYEPGLLGLNNTNKSYNQAIQDVLQLITERKD